MTAKKTWLGVALALLVASLAAPAGARPPGGRGGPGQFVARHAERLGLDADTQAAIERIVAESETREEALRGRIAAARERMRELLDAPDASRDAVMRQADELDALHAESHRNRLDAMLSIHEQLTPAQREALVRLRDEERPRRRGPMGPCRAELREHCPDATDGPARLRCLADRWAELPEPCRDAFSPPP
jgi:Spy/CpxP family protein refolding chaperone